MTTFAQLLKETNQIQQLASEFSANYLQLVDITQNTPCVSVPATETTQGEQTSPIAKPNGVTR